MAVFQACHNRTYDNKADVRQMLAQQQDMKIPSELIPHCPVCGASMTMNLRCDNSFVQDEGWYAARYRYSDFVRRHKQGKVLYLELCGNQYPRHYQVSFLEIHAGKPRCHLCLRELRTGIRTQGNRRAFRLSGCGHWMHPVSTEPRGGFIKNGQSFYHKR